jgi:uncharacterized protein YndB with AHSA1/START domain
MTLDPGTDLILTRTLKAPRALVWDCWTNPAYLPHWFVPRPHRVVACDLDVRVGGRCNTTFEVDGAIIPNEGVYLEVIEGEKLVFTDTSPHPLVGMALFLWRTGKDGLRKKPKENDTRDNEIQNGDCRKDTRT